MKKKEVPLETVAFSIVMPVFNEEEYIRVAINSVFSQIYNNWELIIIDDGSTDQTSDICKSYNNKILYYYQDNKGLSAARNVGVEKSTNPYICFLDGDDFLHQNHLYNLSNEILRQGIPEAIFRTEWVDFQNGVQKQVKEDHNRIMKEPGKYFLVNTPVMHSMCFHRRIFNHFQFSENMFSWEDVHFMIRATSQYPIYQIEGHTACYRRNNQKAKRDDTLETYYSKYYHEIDCINDLVKNHYNEIRKNVSIQDLKSAKFKTTLNFGYIALFNNDLKKARFAYQKGKVLVVSFTSFLRLFKLRSMILLRSLFNK